MPKKLQDMLFALAATFASAIVYLILDALCVDCFDFDQTPTVFGILGIILTAIFYIVFRRIRTRSAASDKPKGEDE